MSWLGSRRLSTLCANLPPEAAFLHKESRLTSADKSIGRNWMEDEALNEDYTNRGRRIEEQVEIMRQWIDAVGPTVESA